MSLKLSYASEADVPADLKPNYKQEGTNWVLDVEGGIVPKSKLDEFRDNNLKLNRQVDEDLKPKLKSYEDIGTVEDLKHLKEIRDQLDESKLIRSNKLEEAVEKRTAVMRDEHTKQIKKLTEELASITAKHAAKVIDEQAVTEALKLGAKKTAVDDIIHRVRGVFKMEEGHAVGYGRDGGKLYGKDGNLLTIAEYLGGMPAAAPHLFEESTGVTTGTQQSATSASRTGTYAGPNPWKAGQRNLTIQMQIEKADPAMAKRLKAEAGVRETVSLT